MTYRANLHLFVYNEQRSNYLRGMKEDFSFPFIPKPGMRVQYKDMYVLEIKDVVWSIDKECFKCTAEDADFSYKFELNDSVEDLTGSLDILRDAKRYGWTGFDKIYRSK